MGLGGFVTWLQRNELRRRMASCFPVHFRTPWPHPIQQVLLVLKLQSEKAYGLTFDLMVLQTTCQLRGLLSRLWTHDDHMGRRLGTCVELGELRVHQLNCVVKKRWQCMSMTNMAIWSAWVSTPKKAPLFNCYPPCFWYISILQQRQTLPFIQWLNMQDVL